MKRQGKQSDGTTGRRDGVVSRFFLISAAVGLLIGLFEAYLLWTTPRIIPLLVPDVGYVIWFLAPLLDMVFFALLGLGLGWLASRTGWIEVLVAVQTALVVAFLTLMRAWFHLITGPPPFGFNLEALFPLACFVAVFIVSRAVLQGTWHGLAGYSERWMGVVLKPLAGGLGAATVVAVAGIGVFVMRPVFSGTPARAAAPPSGAPNIVFITLDTVRADHLSAYGYARPTTPNLDRFARTGVLFENAIAPTSWTLASHASMFTGLLPQQHGADYAVPLSSSPWPLAEILRSQGYETVGFAANRGYLQKGWGIARGFSNYEDVSDSLRHNLERTALGTDVIQPLYQRFARFDYFDRQNAGQLNKRIYGWFQNHRRGPFFLFINYCDTHDPYVTSAPYDHRFGKVSMDSMRRFFGTLGGENESTLLSTRPGEILATAYDNSLAYLDDQVGNLLTVLRQSPGWQNTIIIITSDHGEEFGGHGSYFHGRNLYREVLHVPLIIAGPGVPQDVRISHLVGTRQLFSTVLDLAGRGKTPFSRSSLARFWNPGFTPAPFDDDVVSELVPMGDLSGQRAMISLTTPQWHYIEHRDGRQELYQWTADPSEKDNLAAASGEQATLESLRSRLIGLVSNATGPWRGTPYLQALDKAGGSSRLNLLFPKPLQPGAADNPFRIGIAQAYFKPQESTPTRPSQSERDLMRSLPYQ